MIIKIRHHKLFKLIIIRVACTFLLSNTFQQASFATPIYKHLATNSIMDEMGGMDEAKRTLLAECEPLLSRRGICTEEEIRRVYFAYEQDVIPPSRYIGFLEKQVTFGSRSALVQRLINEFHEGTKGLKGMVDEPATPNPLLEEVAKLYRTGNYDEAELFMDLGIAVTGSYLFKPTVYRVAGFRDRFLSILAARLEEQGISNQREYLQRILDDNGHLRSERKEEVEIFFNKIIQSLPKSLVPHGSRTTYLNRFPGGYSYFSTTILPSIITKKLDEDKKELTIKIIGLSTGEEAASIYYYVKNAFEEHPEWGSSEEWNIVIHGMDLFEFNIREAENSIIENPDRLERNLSYAQTTGERIAMRKIIDVIRALPSERRNEIFKFEQGNIAYRQFRGEFLQGSDIIFSNATHQYIATSFREGLDRDLIDLNAWISTTDWSLYELCTQDRVAVEIMGSDLSFPDPYCYVLAPSGEIVTQSDPEILYERADLTMRRSVDYHGSFLTSNIFFNSMNYRDDYNREEHINALVQALNEGGLRLTPSSIKRLTLLLKDDRAPEELIQYATRMLDACSSSPVVANARYTVEELLGDEHKDRRLVAARVLKEREDYEKIRLPGRVEADLHLHTYHSDGYQTPTALVYEAWRRGLKAIALTDHNNLAGIEEAIEAGRIFGVEVMPAVEIMTTDYDELGTEILVYWPNAEAFLSWYRSDASLGARRKFEEMLNAQEEIVREAIRGINERYSSLGMVITEEEVLQASRNRPLTTGSLAEAIWKKYGKERGRIEIIDETSRITINNGDEVHDRLVREFISFSGDAFFRPVEAVRFAKENSGVAVMAHPRAYLSKGRRSEGELEEYIRNLAEAGLTGLQVSDWRNSDEATRLFKKLAEQFGLVAIVGSDYHGGPYSPQQEMARGRVNRTYPDGNLDRNIGSHKQLYRLRLAQFARTNHYAQLDEGQQGIINSVHPETVVRNVLAGVMLGEIERQRAVTEISAYISRTETASTSSGAHELARIWVERASAPLAMVRRPKKTKGDQEPEQRQKTVLIVEDEEVVAAPIRMALEMEGYRVVIVETAEAAMRLLESDSPPDMVITDLSPDTKNAGIGILRKSKQLRIPAIGMTASTDELSEFDRLMLEKSGARQLFGKPFDLAQMVDDVVRNFAPPTRLVQKDDDAGDEGDTAQTSSRHVEEPVQPKTSTAVAHVNLPQFHVESAKHIIRNYTIDADAYMNLPFNIHFSFIKPDGSPDSTKTVFDVMGLTSQALVFYERRDVGVIIYVEGESVPPDIRQKIADHIAYVMSNYKEENESPVPEAHELLVAKRNEFIEELKQMGLDLRLYDAREAIFRSAARMREIHSEHMVRKNTLITKGRRVLVPEGLIPQEYIELLKSENKAIDIEIVTMEEARQIATNPEEGKNCIILLTPDDLREHKVFNTSYCHAQKIILEDYDFIYLECAIALARAIHSKNEESIKFFYSRLTREYPENIEEIIERRATVRVPIISIDIEKDSKDHKLLQREAYKFLKSA